MKGKLFFLLSLLFFIQASAENKNIFNLQQCIEYAENNNERIKTSYFNRDLSKIEYQNSKLGFIPSLEVGLNQGWNFGRGVGEDNTYANKTLSNTNLMASSSLVIFDGLMNIYNLRKNKYEYLASEESILKEKENLTFLIMTYYLQVLLSKELLSIAEQNHELSVLQIQETSNLVEAGKFPISRLAEVESQAATDKLAMIEARKTLQQAIFNLAQEINYTDWSSFSIAEINDFNLELIFSSPLSSCEAIYQSAMESKPVMKEAHYRLKIAEINKKTARAEYLPKLFVNVNYINNYYYDYSPTEFNQNLSFSEQLKNNGGENITLTLSIPIFDQNRKKVKKARINYHIQKLQQEEELKNLYKDIQDAHWNTVLSKEKYLASEIAEQASTKMFNQIKDIYEMGKATFFEYNEAKNKYIQSQSYLVQAKYEYIFRFLILNYYDNSENIFQYLL